MQVMKLKSISLLFFIGCQLTLFGQLQTVSGFIRDKETSSPIEKAEVSLIHEESTITKSVISSASGDFTFENVPVGRIILSINHPKYNFYQAQGLIVTSGKQLILNIELELQFERMGTVQINQKTAQGQTNNDAALTSARLFTVDETDRFAGSRGDPARMASNFAGVQGADDSRNDIVVRGNSPGGILWRMEGIDIPNPNHFAIPGTTGGSVSIINNKILANSDFFTGAFPAEYGNGVAGAFDLKLRNGNTKKHEVSSQLGILGWDLLMEGPLSKKSGASYLFTYRYSTLDLFNRLNIPIGTDAIPRYQDASFKLNFPLKNNAKLSFFGIGGTSKIDILISDKLESTRNLYGDNDRDQLFNSSLGVVGATYQMPITKKGYFKITGSYNIQQVNAIHHLVFRTIIDTFERDGEVYNRFNIDSTKNNLNYRFSNQNIAFHAFVNTSINARATLKYGVQYTMGMYSYFDEALNLNPDLANYWTWSRRWNALGTSNMLIPYIQLKYKINPKLTMVAGLQSHVFHLAYNPMDNKPGTKNESHTNAAWILPRISAKYQLNAKNSLNFGFGIHSQTQSPYIYFYNKPEQFQPHNLDMGLTKSAHYILGWDYQFRKSNRLKVETYYQNLWDIPVEKISSSFSLANTGSGFSRFFPEDLQNTGTAMNYGIELTLERFFSKGFYFLISTSLFDAKYKGSDGILRNSDFNTNYAANALIAKEFTFKNKAVLNIGGKITLAGARHFSPIDSLASLKNREYIELDAQKNTEKFERPYMRFDVRVSYRINGKKVSHEIALDLINVTNNKNILNYTYINEPPNRRIAYQLGFLPLFYYKIDFSL